MKLLDIYRYDEKGAAHPMGQVAINERSGQVDGRLPKNHSFHPDITNLERKKAHQDLFKASLVDCVPDAWGKAVLAILHKLPKVGVEDVSYLPYLNNIDMLVGNTVFIEAGKKLPKRVKPPILKGKLLKGADNLDGKEDLNLLEETLLMAMGAPPGARSKALVTYKCKPALAKFKSSQDEYDVLGSEYVCMKLAQACGMEVPNAYLETVSEQKVLIQERFDVPLDTPEGRYSLMSFRSAAGLTVFVEDDYSELAALVRKYSENVLEDVEKLYQAMIFNVAIGNTEDHHRNFSFINRGDGWQLSPTYDVTPAYVSEALYNPVTRNHAQRFGGEFEPSKENLLALADSFGLSHLRAQEMLLSTVDHIHATIDELTDFIDEGSRDIVVKTILEGVSILAPERPKPMSETIGDISGHRIAPLPAGFKP